MIDYSVPTTSFRYTSDYASIEDAVKHGLFKDGDIVSIGSDAIYVYFDNHFEPLGSPSDSSTQSQQAVSELVDMKCTHCGAPIHIISKFQSEVRCEYCGSIYIAR